MSETSPFDVWNEQEREAQAKQHRANRQETLKADLVWLMEQPRGRRVLWGIMEEAGLFRTSFTGNSETFLREGERNVALRLQAQLIWADRQKFAAMLQEQISNG